MKKIIKTLFYCAALSVLFEGCGNGSIEPTPQRREVQQSLLQDARQKMEKAKELCEKFSKDSNETGINAASRIDILKKWNDLSSDIMALTKAIHELGQKLKKSGDDKGHSAAENYKKEVNAAFENARLSLPK